MKKTLGIYIHVPLCRKRCPYCHFYSVTNYDDSIISGLIDRYIQELKNFSSLRQDHWIQSIYFGGGTPSILSCNDIERIINEILRIFATDGEFEITIELNPEDFAKIKDLISCGINRFSVGVQSLNDSVLRRLKRMSDKILNIRVIKELVRKNVSVSADIIYGVNVENRDVSEEIRELLYLDIDHISVYELETDNTSLLASLLQREEEWCRILDVLERSELLRYEVSNFSKQDQFCKHNMLYWQMGDWLGIGPSAVGNLNYKRGFIRIEHPMTLGEYLYGSHAKISRIYEKDAFVEYLIMALRTKKGALWKKLKSFNIPNEISHLKEVIDRYSFLVDEGLLMLDDTGIRLTTAGLDRYNSIVVNLLH